MTPCIRNHHHVELPLTEAGNGQADAVNGDGALANEIRCERRWKPDRQPARLAFLPDLFDDADTIDVSKHEVAVHPAITSVG